MKHKKMSYGHGGKMKKDDMHMYGGKMKKMGHGGKMKEMGHGGEMKEMEHGGNVGTSGDVVATYAPAGYKAGE